MTEIYLPLLGIEAIFGRIIGILQNTLEIMGLILIIMAVFKMIANKGQIGKGIYTLLLGLLLIAIGSFMDDILYHGFDFIGFFTY